MKNITLYTILSYILFPFAALFGLISIVTIFLAFVNPGVLLPVFMMSAVVIYTICSFIFLQKGIKHAKPCKAGLKDWIKVNAYVAIGFSSVVFVQSVGILSHPSQLKELLEQTMEMQKTTLPPQVSFVMLINIMKGTFLIMSIFSAILAIHIFISFRLLKIYNYVFDKE